MTFFKVIIDKKIVDVGNVFLKWDEKYNQMYSCDKDEGQFVQGQKEHNIYRANWMRQYPSEATGFQPAEVVIINDSDYDDIYELLSSEQTIDQEMAKPENLQIEEPIQHEEEEPKETSNSLSVAEMKKLILKQQEQIDFLLKQITDK